MALFFPDFPHIRLLVLLCIGIGGIWFCQWEYDAPYVTSELNQQVYLTDEGLYLKPAIALAKTGTTTVPRDANLTQFTTPVHVWLTAKLLQIAGPHWTVTRWLSIFISGIGLISFWSICRISMNASMAWLATLAAATNFMFFHSIRLATADPTGLGLSLLAIWIWAANRKYALGVLLALCVGLAAAWAKPTYAPLLVAIGVTECAAIWADWRSGAKGDALRRITVLGAGALLQSGLLAYNLSLVARTVVHTHPKPAGFWVSFGTGVRQLLDSFVFNMPILPMATAMLLVAVVGFFWQNRERQKELLLDPVVILFLTWILFNTTFVGLFSLQAARYYFGAIFGWTYLAFRVAAWNGSAYSLRYATALMLINLSAQIPFYNHWRLQRPHQSYVAISRDVARRITEANPGRVTLLGHGLSDWIELFDPRIQSLDFGYRGLDAIDPLSSRVDYWRPQYILVNEDDLWTNSDALEDLRAKCAPFWKEIRLVAEYRLLFRNSFPNSSTTKPNLKLYQISYQEKTAAEGQGTGGKPPISSK